MTWYIKIISLPGSERRLGATILPYSDHPISLKYRVIFALSAKICINRQVPIAIINRPRQRPTNIYLLCFTKLGETRQQLVIGLISWEVNPNRIIKKVIA